MSSWSSWGRIGGSLGLWGPLGPLGSLLGPSWGPLGGLLRVSEVDLKLNIILEDLHFSGGPSWSCLGVVFLIFFRPFLNKF